jgi:hypothetical protein
METRLRRVRQDVLPMEGHNKMKALPMEARLRRVRQDVVPMEGHVALRFGMGMG